jgi:peptide/nickel transport system permease protein
MAAPVEKALIRPLRTRSARTQRAVKRLMKHIGVPIGGLILIAVVLSALFAPVLAPSDPFSQDTPNRLAAPSLKHPFGTDHLGRDLLSRVLYGGRYSLAIGIGAVLLAFVLAMVAGIVFTYYGGMLEAVSMRIVDGLIAFPTLLLSLVFVALFGNELIWVVVAVSVGVFPRMTRLIRSSVIEKKELNYIEAARALGTGDWRIMWKHILPNVLAPILVSLTFETSTAILVESSLGFLGLGVQPPTPTWGSIISEGRNFLRASPNAVLFSGAAISMTLLSLNLLGDALRDYFDPRLRT